MLVKFWGVRGSTPTATPGNLKYGGNTACVEVRTSGNQFVILDAGSGIRDLGRHLQRQMPPDGHSIVLFLTHYHWDHIQGLPFFEPMYAPNNRIYLHGFPTSGGGIEGALSEQMANPFFPVDMSVMHATRNFYDITEETLQIGDAHITTRFLNHPQGCLGYRIKDGHGTVVYASDNEHGKREFDRKVLELADGADVFIYDAQYTPQEYTAKIGWGHSTWEQGVRIAKEAGAKELILFHHDPDHSDLFIDNVVREARLQFANVHAAREGMEIDLTRLASDHAYEAGFEKRYNSRHQVPLPMQIRLCGAGGHEEYTMAEDISFDGAYFFSARPIEPGKEIDMELAIGSNGSTRVLKTTARVVRCENVGDRIGVGITFQ